VKPSAIFVAKLSPSALYSKNFGYKKFGEKAAAKD